MLFQYASTVQVTPFGDVIAFFARLGIYDVILPFLLVFTIVFAIFERTKVLGTEKMDGQDITKKNLNAMASFVIAFLVIASSQAVSIINQSMPRIVILLFLGVFYLLLVGIFYSEKEEVLLAESWKLVLMGLMFIGIVLIFLDSIPTENGESWLSWAFKFVVYNFRTTAVSSIIMVVVIIAFLMYIIREPSKGGGSKKESASHDKS